MPDLPQNDNYTLVCQHPGGSTSVVGNVMAGDNEEALLKAAEVVKAKNLEPDATIYVNHPNGDAVYEITVAELVR